VPVVLLGASSLLLGFLHGLGLDHLMAIAALSIDGRHERRHHRVMMTAVQFACGHALMLGAGVVLALSSGWILPAALASGAERLGGGVLVLLGAAGLWSTWTGWAYGHLHRETDGRARWHMHFGAHTHAHTSHAHSALPVAMGAVFAISSLRALVLLAPLGASLTSLAVPVVLLLVVLFGLGILLSMSLFGVVLARLISLRRLETVGRWAGVIVAAASVMLGAYWMI
jgi:nickel/cobalt transporter (NicO) family protein